MACGQGHFEARQRPEAPEYWHHLSVSGWPEVCRAHTKACKQVWAKNYQFDPEGTLQEEDDSNWVRN